MLGEEEKKNKTENKVDNEDDENQTDGDQTEGHTTDEEGMDIEEEVPEIFGEKLEIDVNSPILDIAHHPHERIGEGYPLGEQLTFLDLTNCRLRKIENLDHLKNLQTLMLRQNLITKVENLKNLISLKHLDLYGNQIKKVDASELNTLQQLEHLVKGLKLPKLRELYYVNNKIKEIEVEGTKVETELPCLELLELGSNRLREIKNLENLTTLKELWLGKNKITEIKGLETLTNLQRLSIQNNRIRKICNLQNLSNLTELYLSENGIELIEGLDTLVNLKLLDVAQNFLKTIDNVEHLIHLEEFWCNDNQISSFREVEKLIKLPSLTTVYFRMNPIFSDTQYNRKLLLILPNLSTVDGFPVIRK